MIPAAYQRIGVTVADSIAELPVGAVLDLIAVLDDLHWWFVDAVLRASSSPPPEVAPAPRGAERPSDDDLPAWMWPASARSAPVPVAP